MFFRQFCVGLVTKINNTHKSMIDSTKGQSDFLLKLAALGVLYFALILFVVIPSKVSSFRNFSFSPQLNDQAMVESWWWSQKPRIFIRDGSYKYASGGFISLTSVEEPIIQVDGYNISGKAKFELYEAEVDDLFAYLLYKQENEQIQTKVDTQNFTLVTTFEE